MLLCVTPVLVEVLARLVRHDLEMHHPVPHEQWLPDHRVRANGVEYTAVQPSARRRDRSDVSYFEHHERELEERKAFKEQEDAKWAAKKKETHRLTHMHDGIAKAEMERIRKERQQQGNEMKSELKVMEGEIKALKEEWKAHGHELQEKHGYEQTKRIKQR